MTLPSRTLLLGMIALLAAGPVAAAQWTVGSATSVPGTPVGIPVSLTGDGATTDADLVLVFDESRLSLPVASGAFPGAASNGGQCARTASNRISVVRFAGTVAPSANTVLCTIPFTVVAAAPAGPAPLQIVAANCAAPAGAQPCTGQSGVVSVTRPGSATVPTAPAFPTLVAFMLAPGTLSAELLDGFDFASAAPAPLASLASPRPKDIAPLLLPRAQGAFKAYLAAFPNTARARLERYVIAEYHTASDAVAGATALRADTQVMAVFGLSGVDFLTPPTAVKPLGPFAAGRPKDATNQYHLDAVQAAAGWSRAGGWALVGIVDSGLDTTHPDLRSFDGPTFVGGNYLPVYGIDFGVGDGDPDERQATVASASDIALGCALPAADARCQQNTPGQQCIVPDIAGHGTHVAGLVGATTTNADALRIEGVCRHCGIAPAKITRHACVQPIGGGAPFVTIDFNNVTAPTDAITAWSAIGVQVMSLSFARVGTFPQQFCQAPGNANDPWCLAIEVAAGSDIAIVAASGNSRGDIRFPAHDARSVAVGGLNAALGFWDDSPGNTINCPFVNGVQSGAECGSNFTLTVGFRRQEVTTPARTVRSTIYRGAVWNPDLGCGDAFGGGATNDGVGLCTGTSMSTPIMSGILGLLRSINPLVRVGDPESVPEYGVRDVVVETTDRATSGLGWNAQLGYGRPNVGAAAARMLGRVRTQVVSNRVTPLFTLYSPVTPGALPAEQGATDFASLATPQGAVGLLRYSPAPYTTGTNPVNANAPPLTPGYGAFPTGAGAPPLTPRANAYILTTEFSPGAGLPTPIPLFLVDRVRRWPLGCAPGVGNCLQNNRDFTLVGSVAHLEQFVAAGYAYRGRQGYIYPRCANEPACIPLGAQRMYRQCNTADDDCAVFLESELAAYQAVGYTAAFPTGSDPVMGYAYPNADTDADGLVDGLERVAGINPNDADSDDDGLLDGQEYPAAGVSQSDPCQGPNVTCLRVVDILFENSFE